MNIGKQEVSEGISGVDSVLVVRASAEENPVSVVVSAVRVFIGAGIGMTDRERCSPRRVLHVRSHARFLFVRVEIARSIAGTVSVRRKVQPQMLAVGGMNEVVNRAFLVRNTVLRALLFQNR